MKMNLVTVLLVTTFSLAMSSANANSEMKADREAVNAACSQEAVTAGCGSATVGKGLLKCLHAYKKANKGFQFSDNCKASMKTLKADRKEKKAAK